MMKSTFLQKKMSIIKDTANKWNKGLFISIFHKKLVKAEPIDSDTGIKLKALHVIGLIIGNLLVLALFLLLYLML